MWKITLLLILFLILGGLLVYKTFFIGNDGTNIEFPVVKVGDNALYVANQRPDPFVVISRVFLSKKAYIVIYEDIDGEPSKIIGNSKILPEGESLNVITGLVRPAVHGESLFAIIHEDSGDGIFSPSIDIPIRDEEGNIISVRFNIDQGAPAR